MLGLLLNVFNKADEGIREFSTIGRFFPNPFGNGAYSASITETTHIYIDELRNHGNKYVDVGNAIPGDDSLPENIFADLEFNNLTIRGSLRCPLPEKQPTRTSNIPPVFKIKGTLDVSGELSANGAGCKITTEYGTIKRRETNKDGTTVTVTYTTVAPKEVTYYSPVSFPKTNAKNFGYSADPQKYLSLFNTLSTSNMLTLGTAIWGGSGLLEYDGGNIGGYAVDKDSQQIIDGKKFLTDNTYSFNNGGIYGGAGGLVFLMFKHLYYIDASGNRIEYGVDSGFPVERICANGVLTENIKNSLYFAEGGGTLIVFANTIIIRDTGKITANGTSYTQQEGTESGSIVYNNTRLIEENRAYLNNLPELGYNQSGLYSTTTAGKEFINGKPDDNAEYCYNDGSTDYISTHSSPRLQARTNKCGGAGCVIGIKI